MLDDLLIFLKIVESNSMADAGRALKISSATIARKLARLEGSMGVKLIERNTRSFALTQAGHHCYQRAQSIPQIITEMQDTLTHCQQSLKGTLNVNISCYSGFHEIIPKIIAFNQAYPGIKLNITKSNTFPDLIDDSYDVYIRYGEVQTRSMQSSPLTHHQMCVCATRNYLKNAPQLETPNDLHAHSLIMHLYNKHEGDEWEFYDKGKTEFVRINSHLILNNSALVLEALENDAGVAYLPYYFIKNNINIVPLLKPYWPPTKTVYLCYPREKHIFEKTRVFVDFLIDAYQT